MPITFSYFFYLVGNVPNWNIMSISGVSNIDSRPLIILVNSPYIACFLYNRKYKTWNTIHRREEFQVINTIKTKKLYLFTCSCNLDWILNWYYFFLNWVMLFYKLFKPSEKCCTADIGIIHKSNTDAPFTYRLQYKQILQAVKTL